MALALGTVWLSASANHLFVYFSANRLVMGAAMAPLIVFAIAAPLMLSGITLAAAVSIAAFACLFFATAAFGFDRLVLLGTLARQADACVQAKQADAAKSQFLATMSHELRTPLNSVIGYAELIQEEAGSGAIAEDAGKIAHSAKHLLGMIDVILDLSKLETGMLELQRDRTQIAAILEQLRESAPPLAAANGNSFNVADPVALGEADIDQARLYQCLMQLVGNAAKFTRHGHIQVAALRRAGQLVFEVSDTGIGIAEVDRQRIFEPFVQIEADPARRYEGAGLGLAFVQRLARLMGGEVTCDSAPGRGSVFRLSIAAA